MAISTDPSVLAAASRCFDTCIPPGDQRAVQTYLWAQITGVTDPATILINARCFNSCIPLGLLPYLQAYLAALLAGGSTDPSTLANAATCFRSCVPVGGNNAIISYELANKAGGSTDPSTLANAARCFSSCIPDGFHLAAQAYLMAVAAGGSTDPAVLATAARCFSSCIPAGLAPSVIASSIATYAGGGSGPSPPVKDPLVTSWQTRAIANGGTPSLATINCLNTFCVGIRAQTYFAKLKSVNFIAPDDFRCAMTPLIVHATDSGLWQAINAGTYTGATTFVSGANATLDGTGIRCDFPWTPNPGTNNFNPAAVFTSASNAGVTVYQTTNDGLHGPFGEFIGSTDGTVNNDFFLAVNYLGNTYMNWIDDAHQIAQAFNTFYGYYSFNVTAANRRDIYFGNSTNAHQTVATSAAVFAGALIALGIAINGSNGNGTTGVSASNHHSFFAIHDGLTTAESADFFTRVQALRVCLGTGFV